MFNTSLFLLLSCIALVANFIAIPKIVSLGSYNKGNDERKVLLISTLTNSIFLSVIAAAVGCYMAPRIGFGSPFFEALASFDQPHTKLLDLMLPASTTSIFILAGMLLIQVVLANRCFALPDYFSLPISTRVLKEGVIEEIIYRWGLIPIVARILNVEFMVSMKIAVFAAISISALGSAISHIPDLFRRNFYRINLAVIFILAVNFWGAIIYGWLFCNYGLGAAIACHAMVIVVSSLTYNFMCSFP